MNYIGRVAIIGEIETVGKNSIEKQSIVLEEITDKEYKGSIAFDLLKDKISLSNGLNIGDVVEVYLNIRATYHEPKDTYYNNITAWMIKKNTSGENGHAFPEDNGDLPF